MKVGISEINLDISKAVFNPPPAKKTKEIIAMKIAITKAIGAIPFLFILYFIFNFSIISSESFKDKYN